MKNQYVVTLIEKVHILSYVNSRKSFRPGVFSLFTQKLSNQKLPCVPGGKRT